MREGSYCILPQAVVCELEWGSGRVTATATTPELETLANHAIKTTNREKSYPVHRKTVKNNFQSEVNTKQFMIITTRNE